jgi:hypothetical protein
MKKIPNLLAAFLILIGSLVFTNSNAQSLPKNTFRFGIGLDGLLPVGNLSNTANFGLGLTPRLQYGVADNVALTFTAGLYHFFTKKLYINEGFGAGSSIENDLDIVPVKIGLKAFVLPNIYIAGEAGLGFEVEDGGGPTKLIVSPGIGYASKKWDLGVRYENFSGGNYSYGVIGLRIAYGFGL